MESPKDPSPIPLAVADLDRDMWVVSDTLTANLTTANPSTVPARQGRRVRDTEINGRAPQLPHPHGLGENHDAHDDHSHGDAHPAGDVTDDSKKFKYAFDTLMADPEPINPETIDRRIPRTFLGRIALRRQIRKIEVKLPEAEQFAATMWHFGDTTLRRQSARTNYERGKHSSSGVTKSEWYARQMRAANPDKLVDLEDNKLVAVENYRVNGLVAPNLNPLTRKQQRAVDNITIVMNERGNNVRREGQRLTHNVAPLLGESFSPKGNRNKSAMAYLAAEERAHGAHMLHEQIEAIRKPAEDVHAMKVRREQLKARLAASEQRKRRRGGEPALEPLPEAEADTTPESPLEIKKRLLTDMFGDTAPTSAEELEHMPKEELSTHILNDVFTYKDVLGEEEASKIDMSAMPTAPAYAEALAELIQSPDAAKVLEASEAIKQKFDTLAELVAEDGALSIFAGSNGWRYWDIAKQELLKAEEYRTSDGELISGSAVNNGDTDEAKERTEFMRNVIAWRHFGWELHRKYTLMGEDSSWINDKISDETKQLLEKIGDAEHSGQLTSHEYVSLGQAAERDLQAWKTSLEASIAPSPITIAELESKPGTVKVKVGGELIENATIISTGKAMSKGVEVDVCVVSYTDSSGNVIPSKFVRSEDVLKWNGSVGS